MYIDKFYRWSLKAERCSSAAIVESINFPEIWTAGQGNLII